MDDRTLTALKTSINHWEENVAATTPFDARIDAEHCALCDVFQPDDATLETACVGCPVMDKSTRKYCQGTPFHAAANYFYEWRKGRASREIFRAAAQAELDFLKSLLPQEPKP